MSAVALVGEESPKADRRSLMSIGTNVTWDI